MTTFDDLVREVRSTLRGYNLVKEQVTFLNGAINSSVLTVTVDDGTLVQPGVIEIGDESLYVQSIVGNVLTISPDGRGWDGTTAASHADNVRVTVAPPFPSWRIARAVNDAITGTYPTLYGVDYQSFTYNPSVTTYQLPATAENVLQVTATTLGPSGEQYEVHSYKFDGFAPPAQYLSGRAITLREGVQPGQTVTVVYQEAPSEITPGDNFTACGLPESARSCVVYGAVAKVLAFLDVSRLSADSANAHEYDGSQRVGTATQIAAQLTARYQMELDKEQARLRKRHPVKVRWIGR